MTIFHLIKYPLESRDIITIRDSIGNLPDHLRDKIQIRCAITHDSWVREHAALDLMGGMPRLMKGYTDAYTEVLMECEDPL